MFSERIEQRYRLFWKARRFGFHGKGRCLLTYLDRDDPIEAWHCCDLWQRKLANKWNAREFAVKHGCRVPDLYWHGKNVDTIPFDALPDRYVIRPVVGHSKQGVYLMQNGVNLMDGRAYSPQELITALRRSLHPLTRRKILVESFIRPEKTTDLRPVECKAFVFGSLIAGIGRIERLAPDDGAAPFSVHWLDENWQPLPDLTTPGRASSGPPYPPPPACLEELKDHLRRLGQAYGTFARIDFYASEEGAVFGEFTATPMLGRRFTEFGNRYLEECWQQAYPDDPEPRRT